jgi:hypothetical protein
VGRLRARAGYSAAAIGSSSPPIHILWHRVQTVRAIAGRGARMFFLDQKLLRTLLSAEPRFLFEQWNSRNEEGQGRRQTILPHGKIFLETIETTTTPTATRILWVLTGSYNLSRKALGGAGAVAGTNIEAGIMYNSGPIHNYFAKNENLDPMAVYCPLPFDIETLQRFDSNNDIFISA